MNVNEANLGTLSGLGTPGASKAGPAGRATSTAAGQTAAQGDAADGVQLSGLAQQLQSLAPESSEREARVEQIARAYANGSYQVDVEATAAGVIDDALRYSKNS